MRTVGRLPFSEREAPFGYALVREQELLGAYGEALRRLPSALVNRRVIQERRQMRNVPFGMQAPA